MAFKRALSTTFTTQVEVKVPNNKGGFDRNTFEAVFRRPVPLPLEEGQAEGGERETDLDVYRREHPDMTDKQLVRDWLVGWKLVDEDTKQPVPFSEVELEALLAIEPTPAATAWAFYQAYRGIKAKN
jgi:hypothetical protein